MSHVEIPSLCGHIVLVAGMMNNSYMNTQLSDHNTFVAPNLCKHQFSKMNLKHKIYHFSGEIYIKDAAQETKLLTKNVLLLRYPKVKSFLFKVSVRIFRAVHKEKLIVAG